MASTAKTLTPPRFTTRLGYWIFFIALGALMGGTFGWQVLTQGPVSLENGLMHGMMSSIYLDELKTHYPELQQLVPLFFQQYGVIFCTCMTLILGVVLSLLNWGPYIQDAQRQNVTLFSGFVQARMTMGIDLVKGLFLGFVLCIAAVVATFCVGQSDVLSWRFLVGCGALIALTLFFFEKLLLLELLTLPTKGILNVILAVVLFFFMLSTTPGAQLSYAITHSWMSLGISVVVLVVVNAAFFHFLAVYLQKRFGP